RARARGAPGLRGHARSARGRRRGPRGRAAGRVRGAMSEPDDENLEEIAASFDGEDEDTSPEVVRHGRAAVGIDPQGNPILVVACQDAGLRRELIELLWSDGWHAVEARNMDELMETVRAMSPNVALVDANLVSAGLSPPEQLRNYRP